MNSTTRLAFLVVALVLAFTVSFTVYKRISTPTVVVAKETGPTMTEIAVARVDMNRGTKISAEHIQMKPYLHDTLPLGHFKEPDQVIGRVILSSISTTAPILENSLAPKDLTKGGMAAVISPNKRAMAVKVDNVIGVAGFLHPGHMVDVLVSIEQPETSNNSQITKTVLENILVLSVGTQAQESTDKKAKKVTVVTLEVDLEEGEKLALAVNEGRIQLALRGYTDIETVLTKGITTSSLLKSYSAAVYEPVKPAVTAPAPKQPKPKPASRQIVVEVMNGNEMNRVKINK